MKYVKLSPKKLSKWRKTSPYGPNAEQRRKVRRAHARYAKMFAKAVHNLLTTVGITAEKLSPKNDRIERFACPGTDRTISVRVDADSGRPVRPYDGQTWLDLFDGDTLKAEEAGSAGNSGAYL